MDRSSCFNDVRSDRHVGAVSPVSDRSQYRFDVVGKGVPSLRVDVSRDLAEFEDVD